MNSPIIGSRIRFTTSRDGGGVIVKSKPKTALVEKILRDNAGTAYVVRYQGKVKIVLDTEVVE